VTGRAISGGSQPAGAHGQPSTSRGPGLGYPLILAAPAAADRRVSSINAPIAGELVHLEDFVLHEASHDICSPTHELTRDHGVLGLRPVGPSAAGLDTLRAGGDAHDHARSASAKATRITRVLVRTSHLWRPICWQEQLPATASRFMSCPAHPFRRAAPSLVTRTATSSSRPRSRCAAPSRRRRPAWPQRIKRHHFCKDRRPAGRGGRDRSRPLW